MRLLIAAVGRLKAGPERALAERYRTRVLAAGGAFGLRAVEIIEIDESRARDPARRQSEESAALLARVPPAARRIALDGRGQALDSAAFAAFVFPRVAHEVLGFFIGGADGHAPQLRQAADRCFGFGPATFPHQLVRIMLLEQIYRAVCIRAGHPYHRE
jgi:23S rRNA (pseudouridine1915-N3)-methyltransferase